MTTLSRGWTALLFPDHPLEIIAVTSHAELLLVTAETSGDSAPCPSCQTVSHSLYSHYRERGKLNLM